MFQKVYLMLRLCGDCCSQIHPLCQLQGLLWFAAPNTAPKFVFLIANSLCRVKVLRSLRCVELPRLVPQLGLGRPQFGFPYVNAFHVRSLMS